MAQIDADEGKMSREVKVLSCNLLDHLFICEHLRNLRMTFRYLLSALLRIACMGFLPPVH
jgi:hypothetical protein